MNDIKNVAFNYGKNKELQRRTHSYEDELYREYEALCRALWRELEDTDAIDADGNLKREYNVAMERGRKSVSESN